MVAARATAPRKAEALGLFAETIGPVTLKPCRPGNDPRHERIVVLIHALRKDIRLIQEEHGDGCECDECWNASGSEWVLELLYSCFECTIIPFYVKPLNVHQGEPADIEEMAQRLDLSPRMVADFLDAKLDRCFRKTGGA